MFGVLPACRRFPLGPTLRQFHSATGTRRQYLITNVPTEMSVAELRAFLTPFVCTKLDVTYVNEDGGDPSCDVVADLYFMDGSNFATHDEPVIGLKDKRILKNLRRVTVTRYKRPSSHAPRSSSSAQCESGQTLSVEQPPSGETTNAS